MTLAAALVFSALVFSATFFPGQAAADGNLLLGEWRVLNLEPPEPTEENVMKGGYFIMLFTQNYLMFGIDGYEGTILRSMTSSDLVTYRKISDGIWSVCRTSSGECMTGTFESGSQDHVILREDGKPDSVLELRRIKF
jgi:hypothetical protein